MVREVDTRATAIVDQVDLGVAVLEIPSAVGVEREGDPGRAGPQRRQRCR
jgi:hypothetical protein